MCILWFSFAKTDGAIASVLDLISNLLALHLQLLYMNLGSHAKHSWAYIHIVQFTSMHSTRCLWIWHYISCTWKLVQINHHWRYTGLWSFSFNVLWKWCSYATCVRRWVTRCPEQLLTKSHNHRTRLVLETVWLVSTRIHVLGFYSWSTTWNSTPQMCGILF